MKSISGLILSLLMSAPVFSAAQDYKPVSVTLQGFEYPYPVKTFALLVEGKQCEMAYMMCRPQVKVMGKP